MSKGVYKFIFYNIIFEKMSDTTTTKHVSSLRRKLSDIQKKDESYTSRFRKNLQKMREEEAMNEIYILEGHDCFAKNIVGVIYSQEQKRNDTK
jgi:hypothetical protein